MRRHSIPRESRKAGIFTVALFTLMFGLLAHYLNIFHLITTNTKVNLIYLVDNSGSMHAGVGEIIKGYNKFLVRNKTKGYKLTMATFGNHPHYLYKDKKMSEVPVLTQDIYSEVDANEGAADICKVANRVSKTLKGEDNLIVIYADQYNDCYKNLVDSEGKKVQASLININGIGRANKDGAFFFEFSEFGIADSFYALDDIIINYLIEKNK